MKRFPSLGNFFAATALLGRTRGRFMRRAPTARYAGQTSEQWKAAIDAAVAKRARKTAKLREHGL